MLKFKKYVPFSKKVITPVFSYFISLLSINVLLNNTFLLFCTLLNNWFDLENSISFIIEHWKLAFCSPINKPTTLLFATEFELDVPPPPYSNSIQFSKLVTNSFFIFLLIVKKYPWGMGPDDKFNTSALILYVPSSLPNIPSKCVIKLFTSLRKSIEVQLEKEFVSEL